MQTFGQQQQQRAETQHEPLTRRENKEERKQIYADGRKFCTPFASQHGILGSRGAIGVIVEILIAKMLNRGHAVFSTGLYVSIAYHYYVLKCNYNRFLSFLRIFITWTPPNKYHSSFFLAKNTAGEAPTVRFY
jgi:hypothetical protein